ncbi:MAG: hypothetical protein E7266_00480 [Lachnospiraceae bacterium]|nr:hypothetical protein [Lachnospiraceae bacterium]
MQGTGVVYADEYEELEIINYICETKQEIREEYCEDELKEMVEEKAIELGISNEDIVSGYNPGLPVASFDEYNSNSRAIIGADLQMEVNPTRYPYSAVLLLRTGQDSDGDGDIDIWARSTAFLEGYDVVVTAGHNVWWPEENYGWSEDIRMYVNQDSFALGQYHTAYSWAVPSGFINNQTDSLDWCVMVSNEDLGSDNGWFSKALMGNLTGTSIRVSGYPTTSGKYGHQYMDYGTILSDSGGLITYNADTEGGQSGSPVFDSNYIVWGIHCGDDITANYGVKMSNTLLNFINNKYLEGLEKWG